MTNRYSDQLDTEQFKARQVGESTPARPQQPAVFNSTAGTSPEIDQLVERVRWVMRREPMLEREMRT